jgi:hypothetical protein
MFRVDALAQALASTAASQIVCPDGQQVSGKFDNCTACPAGNYSVSGGEVIQWYCFTFCVLRESD